MPGLSVAGAPSSGGNDVRQALDFGLGGYRAVLVGDAGPGWVSGVSNRGLQRVLLGRWCAFDSTADLHARQHLLRLGRDVRYE